MNTVSANEARLKFAELLERAYYRDDRFQVKRNNKAIAWIVGEPFMHVVDQLVEQVIEHHPSLADSLAISTDTNIRRQIIDSQTESTNGKRLPLSSILDD